MRTHPFDEAMALVPLADGQSQGQTQGHTHTAYWNMVGPYGGITAAVALQAVLEHPQRLGEPVALTVNFAGAMAEGSFIADAQPVRTNRSTQHWLVQLRQTGADGQAQVTTTATVVTALQRDTFSDQELHMPQVPPPEQVAANARHGVAWLQRYEMRPLEGGFPAEWDGQIRPSLSRLWLRDKPPRPPCFASLAALADVFFPRIWLRRATMVPVGTVSMTVYFHASAAQLAAVGQGYLLAQVQGQAYRHGFFDHSGQLWAEDGTLLASTHQVVYFKS